MGTKRRNYLETKSFNFSINIVKFVIRVKVYRNLWIIADQLLRSGTSIGANISEAQFASSKREFTRYYQISLKSCNETLYWLDLINDSKIIKDTDLDNLIELCSELGRLLNSSIKTLKGKIN